MDQDKSNEAPQAGRQKPSSWNHAYYTRTVYVIPAKAAPSFQANNATHGKVILE